MRSRRSTAGLRKLEADEEQLHARAQAASLQLTLPKAIKARRSAQASHLVRGDSTGLEIRGMSVPPLVPGQCLRLPSAGTVPNLNPTSVKQPGSVSAFHQNGIYPARNLLEATDTG